MAATNKGGISEEKLVPSAEKCSCKINRKLLPVKLQYFIFLAALGCALPYRTVFLKQLGFSGAAIGTIFTIVPFVKIITNPLFGAIVDYSKSFRLTNIVILILVALSHILIVFVPPLTPNSIPYSLQANVQLSCNDKNTEIQILESHMNANLSSTTNTSCYFKCSVCDKSYNQYCEKECKYGQPSLNFHTITTSENVSETVVVLQKTVSFTHANASFEKDINRESQLPCFCNALLNCTSEFCALPTTKSPEIGLKSVKEFESPQFWSLFVLITISSATFAATLFLMDAACFEILEDQPEKYGQQRLWGAAGFGAGSVIGGYVNDLVTGHAADPDYTYCFYALAVMCLINIIPVAYIKVENFKYSKSIFRDVGRLLCNVYFLTYVILLTFVGILSGLIWNYETWLLEDIGASPLLLGLAMAAECFLSELPCFIIAGWVIKKIGHRHCMSLTFLCFGARYIGFAYLKDPWFSLLLSLLHGPTFGIFFASVTTFGKENAPSGTEATVQALLSLAFEGIGVGIGSLIGGIAFETLGGQITFWYTGIVSFIFLGISIIWDLLLSNCGKPDQALSGIENPVHEEHTEAEKNNEA